MHLRSRAVYFFGLPMLACLAQTCLPVSAATYYVRTSGNDSNSGTSAGSAYKTIVKAGTKAQAGDKVYVGAGSYSGTVNISNDGTSGSPIEFIADTAGTFTGDAGTVTATSSGSVIFSITNDNYITLNGFVISGGTKGVHIDGSTGAVVKNCTVQSSTDRGIHINSSSAKIEKCTVKNTSGTAIHCQNGSFNAINCLILNSNSNGIYAESLSAASTVQHCTIHDANGDGIDHDGGTLTVNNSIISSCNGKGFLRNSGTLTHDYNIAYNNSSGNFSGTSQNSNEWTSDPKYTSSTDFHLQATSPAIDKGTSLSVSDDRDGNSRPSGPKSDLGCYERNSGGVDSPVWYVRTSGNDSNSGTTAALAFRSITRAASVANAGDVVWIGAGTYDNAISPAYDGTSGSPIRFRADTTGTQTGDAGTIYVTGSSARLDVDNKDYIEFYNIEFGGSTGGFGGGGGAEDDTSTGIDFLRFEDCVGALLKDCKIGNCDDAVYVDSAQLTVDATTIDNNEKSGIRVLGSTSKLTVLNSTISRCGYRGIDISDATEVTIENTKIHSNGSHGIRSEANSSSDKLIVRRCEIYSNDRDGVHLHGSSQVTFENCLIRSNDECGIKTHSGSCVCTVNHSTFARNGTDGIRHENGTITVTNSIASKNTDDGFERTGGTFTNTYSCSHGNSGTNWSGTSAGTGSITLDPKFASTSDYHLLSSSPCINVGTSGLTVDLEGKTRPTGAAVDLGCYESNVGASGSGTHYYVRTIGSDTNNGLSPANAFRTIGKAINVVVAGDIVWVGAGNYAEAPNLVSKNGTSSQPITFNADTDGSKTGDAGTVTVQGGFYLQNSSNVTIRLFTLAAGSRKATWSSYYTGTHLSGCSNVQLEELKSTGGSYGFLVESSPNTTVSECKAETASTHGFCFQGATTTGSATGSQANSNSQAGYYVAQGTISLNGCTSSSNGTHGFRYDAARGTLSGCSSTSDYLGAALLGVNNDRTSLTATNLTIQSSQNGAALLQVCTAEIVPVTQPLSTSGPYGIYVDNANLTLDNGVIRNTQYGVQVAGGGSIVLSNCTIENCTNDGVEVTGASTATLTNCQMTGCRDGIRGNGNSNVSATSCTLGSNSGWGINVSGRGSVSGCTLTSNYQGASLTGQTARGDITIANTTIDGTTREGLLAIRCTGNVSGAAGTLSQGGSYGAYVEDSELTLSNFRIQGPDYGITAYGSTLALSGGTITSSPSDGIYLNNCETTMSGSTISSCRYGIRSEDGGNLSVDTSTLSSNTSWAIIHTGHGSINNSTISNNYQGLYLVGEAVTGDITLNNTKVQGTTAEGLALFRCSGNIPAGTDKVSKGGSYGVYLNACNLIMTAPEISGPQYGFLLYSSSLTASSAVVSSCSHDGIYAENSTLALTSCQISSCRYGVLSNNASTVNARQCTFTSNTAWAIHHTGYGLLQDLTLTNNYQGLTAVGAVQTGDITLDDIVIQGTTREGLSATRCEGTILGGNDKLSKGGSYGAYLLESDLSMSNVQITGADHGILCYSSTLNLTDSTISDLPMDGVFTSASTLNLSDCAFARCRYGLRGTGASTLIASSSSFESTTTWGVYHEGYGSITDCSLNNCAKGMYLIGATQASDLQFVNATIQGTAQEGLVAIRAGGNVLGGAGRLSNGGAYGAYFTQANVNLSNVAIHGAQYGIISDESTFSLVNSAVTATTSTGILATESTITLTNATFSDCGSRGIDCQSDSTLTATSCRFERSGDWGIVLAGLGTLTSCVVDDNQYGAYFTGKTNRGDIQLVNLTLNGSTGDGLVAVRCEGSILGGATFSGGGDWGLYSSDSELTLTGATLSGNVYGIYSDSSDLTVQTTRVTGATYGVYSTDDEDFSLASCRIENCSNWGLQSYQGRLQMTNCVVGNNSRGVYLENAYQANVWNATIAGNTLFGLSQNNGVVDLKNNIISGTNAGVGILRTSGILTSSHNLVYGFATNVSGTTLDDNSVVKNPRFVNATGGDYRLLKGSPAINSGVDMVGSVDQDILGAARPAYRRWEMGAHEYANDDASLRILQWGEQR